MAIILDQLINDIDLSVLSVKSSKRINVRCSECDHIWITSKSSIANKTTRCHNCFLASQSPWFHDNDLKELLESILIHPENLPVKQSSEEKVKVLCPDCNTYMVKNWRNLLKTITSSRDWCFVCHPAKGMKTGELLAENHPDLAQRCQEELDDFALFYTSKKYLFSFKCGHAGKDTPKTALVHDDCIKCREEKNKIKRSEWTNPLCSKCGKEHEVSRRTYLQNIRELGVHLCTDCKILENPYFLNDNFSDIEDLLTANGLSWSDNNPWKMKDVSLGSSKVIEFDCKKGHSFSVGSCSVDRKFPSCPRCRISTGEKSLSSFIEELLPENEIIFNSRRIIAPYELDIYFPELSIAIEYNGLYWHSESQGKDRNYHYNKWKMCKDKGIQLITIWEDDWLDNTKQTIVKSMLTHKLSMSDKRKVYARNTYVAEIDSQQAREFCDVNHIQGFTPGSLYLGLKDKKTNELVALSIWRKNKENFYLDRYCTSVHVIGGLGKLLKLALVQARAHNCLHIVTFADREVSDGGIYEKLGFVVDKELKPDCSYIVQHKRVHKFNYRKKRFKNDSDLKFKEGLSESELAKLNNIHKIWDCGKIRYVLNL